MKTLRVTLADIIGPTGTPNSTATVHARYVDTSGRGRDVHLTDGTIVVPVRRVASPDGDPEVFDFDVYANDVAPVREVDYGHLVEVSWTVVAPTGAKSSGVKRVQITDSMASVVQLGLLATPTPVPPYTGGYALAPDLAAEVATRAAADAALDGRVDALEVAPPAHAHAGGDITSGTVAYARLPVGTAASTLAAGDDSRITGAAQKSANLSDLASASTARTNLGLTDSAVVGALPIPDPGSFYPTDTLTAALQLIGGRERYGTGSPLGVVSAPVGTYYTDTAGTNGAWRWLKKSGAGNTGWVCVEGDTGWRNVTASLSNIDAANAGTLSLRRIDDAVTWRFSNLLLSAGSGTLSLWAAIPLGFRGASMVSLAVQRNNSQAHVNRIGLNVTGLGWIAEEPTGAVSTSTRPAIGLTGLTAPHATDDAWPTSLPGVAA